MYTLWTIVQCHEVNICMSFCLFSVVVYTLWLCGKCYCEATVGNEGRCGERVCV